ncbi:MAG: RcnB family protein [Rhodospirillales bacterium]
MVYRRHATRPVPGAKLLAPHPATYGLYPPPPGTQWIRVDYDALLVTIATGQVLQVVPGIFY